ncbi:MAG: TlpA family protein disulfide reductase [Nevskiaceae bacterium]|nr:MAG: TlpA family protein disulfide reductase [Nevskiaceae bacterium]TBR73948.1 MAG: TlpA family protein disulfide reductase [Nevskiaceae bacterium]
MNVLSLGPLALPLTFGILLVCIIAAIITARRLARERRADATDRVMTGVIVALLAARAAFVIRYWPQYADAPLSMLDIRDGGFGWIGALLGIAAYASWALWRQPGLRKALGGGLAAAAIAWAALNGIAGLLDNSQLTRPAVALTTPDGAATSLDALAAAHPGLPMVVNLWATWCPPCRAELPMLVAAQKAHPDVVFVFVDQGEALDTVRDYLRAERLAPRNLLLDGHKDLARVTNTMAFPTTFFFTPDGHLATQHMGMLSKATLARALGRLHTARPVQPAPMRSQ